MKLFDSCLPRLTTVKFLFLCSGFLLAGSGMGAETKPEDFGGNAMADSQKGYYRYPAIYGERVVFVAEDDLWEVPAAGGVARRLTASRGTVSSPCYSPDGTRLAFVGTEEGQSDVYVMSAAGGPVERVTFLGSQALVVGWEGDRILFYSGYGQAFRHPGWLYRVARDGTDLERLNYGPANRISCRGRSVVLGRNNGDPARWKRYRGGTAGELWIDEEGKGEFHELIDLKGNMADPMFVGERIYFLSDHEGIGNLYSCRMDGTDVRKHTGHTDFYARNASTDGKRIVYHAGADLFVYDPATEQTNPVAVEFHSSRAQTNRKFVAAEDYLEDYEVSADSGWVAVVSRGKSFAMGCWEGAVYQQGMRHGVRYRLARFLADGQEMVVCSDEGGQEHLEVHSVHNDKPVRVIPADDLGRPMQIQVSPKGDAVLVVNHRNQLLLVELATGGTKVIDQDRYRMLGGCCWSADGRWVAYGCTIHARQSVIKIYDVAKDVTRPVTRAVLWDYNPVFDPEGNYLFFLSGRIFNPVYDNLHFTLGFPRGTRPYAIPLCKDVASPFVAKPEGFRKKDQPPQNEKKDAEEGGKSETLEIDFDGIEDRVVSFPVEEGIYEGIGAGKGRVFYTVLPIEGSVLNHEYERMPPARATLKYYDWKKREETVLAEAISGFKLSPDGSALAMRAGKRLRVLPAEADKLPEKGGESAGRTSGWVDLGRLKVEIEPRAEWRQMLAEAWRLQRDYYWREDMSGVAWQAILDRYLPLVDRVSSRGEFGDLAWEMQGELGTSHAYEFGGDYREGPAYTQGYLGADLEYEAEQDAWRIRNVVHGDTWDLKNAPPLLRPGVNVTEGMLLLAVEGQEVSRGVSPYQLLVNHGGDEVSLTVAESDGSGERAVEVQALPNETMLRYRDWVEGNREFVHAKSNGRVGYVPIPNMGTFGYGEFYRYFLVELDYDGLLVDVRYNGGGHVSQLLLENLTRKRIGLSQSRWMGEEAYPMESPKGPMVCLTNENAGSDGDIVCQAFKLMGLGKLIGKRTWGGVVGIWPRNWLVDGTVTTQPEYSFCFEGIGFGVENHGVDPDIEVDILPQDWAAGRDPQLERAIEEVLKEIERNPQ